MHCVVLGAGVIGTTTAWYLARAGHSVTVLERRPGPGLDASYANGALLTPSLSDPWAAPGVPRKMLHWLGREDAPLLLRLRAVPGMAGWGLRFLANCRTGPWRRNTEAILRLARFSHEAFADLTRDRGFAFDRSDLGTLRIYRDAESWQAAQEAAAMYGELGLSYRLLDADACVALEPGLRPVRDRIAGAVHYPEDRSGDAYAFTQALADRAAALGAAFRYGATITRIAAEGDRVEAVATDRGAVTGDVYVMALGSYSPLLARGLRLRLPVYPVKGYSVTLGIAGWNGAPRVPVLDDRRKIGITRLGDRLRLAGTVEFAGYDASPNKRRSELLLAALGEVFPDWPRNAPREDWCGLRPMTPDGRPILGRSAYRNLFLNTGHGPLGWTLACGSGRAVAALVEDRRPEIDLEDFALARF